MYLGKTLYSAQRMCRCFDLKKMPGKLLVEATAGAGKVGALVDNFEDPVQLCLNIGLLPSGSVREVFSSFLPVSQCLHYSGARVPAASNYRVDLQVGFQIWKGVLWRNLCRVRPYTG